MGNNKDKQWYLYDCKPISGGDCVQCGEWRGTDIYWCGGFVLCGDCRYFLRHGRTPSCPTYHPPATAEPEDDEEAAKNHGTTTYNRSRVTHCRSMQEYNVLMDIERGTEPHWLSDD